MLISFDGLDSSGKATQSRLLTEYLTNNGIQASNFRSPDYDIASGKELKLRLQNKLGNWQETPWQEKMGYFAANRMEHKAEVQDILSRGGFVIYDRYVPSSIAFMIVEAAQGTVSDTLRKQVRGAVEKREYEDNGMPREDVSLFFDIPPKVAVGLLKGRKEEHGHEDEYTDYLHVQEALHEEYLQLAQDQPGHILRVACMDEERLRGIDEIAGLVREALAQKFPDQAQLFT